MLPSGLVKLYLVGSLQDFTLFTTLSRLHFPIDGLAHEFDGSVLSLLLFLLLKLLLLLLLSQNGRLNSFLA